MRERPVDISLLAIDIDGTLVAEGDRVTPATRRAVREACAQLTVVLATGRRYRTTQLAIEQIDLPLPAICLGGALTKDADGKTTHCKAFTAPQIPRLLELARRHGLALLLHRDSHQHGGADFVIDGSIAWNEYTQRYMASNGAVGQVDDAPETAGHDDILMAGCFAEQAPLAALQRDIEADGVLATVLVEAQKTPGWYLETIPSHVDKWVALRRFAVARGIAPGAICAVGDALNDLPMIRGAGLGVAMGNATAEVRQAADWITGDNTEDGVAMLIDKLLARSDR